VGYVGDATLLEAEEVILIALTSVGVRLSFIGARSSLLGISSNMIPAEVIVPDRGSGRRGTGTELLVEDVDGAWRLICGGCVAFPTPTLPISPRTPPTSSSSSSGSSTNSCGSRDLKLSSGRTLCLRGVGSEAFFSGPVLHIAPPCRAGIGVDEIEVKADGGKVLDLLDPARGSNEELGTARTCLAEAGWSRETGEF
jgi:hypothetical protein